ncbi:MAG: type II toxin-antitoxin system YafQ family toxin [Gammaproteobacteria bacterium]|nr:type II toxin-antitoxin system YafQ family toxin [Gammaproteobacteria bacterium]
MLTLLISDKILPENNYDHSLSGEWRGYRECHVKPDLLLIYKIIVKKTKSKRICF